MIDKKLLDEIKKNITTLEQKPNKSETENLRMRNLQRIVDTEEKQSVYCPLEKTHITNLMKCMFCQFGHMTECHYPHDCDSEYCNHYKEEEVDLDEAY